MYGGSSLRSAVKSALSAREIGEKDFGAWDLSDAGIPPDGAGLLIGGEIKTLWLDSRASVANTIAKANVELRIVVADLEQKKIVRVLNVSSKIERQNISPTPAFLNSVLSEALSAAIDQLFADEEIKNRIK
jgi:hypothetical protein